MIRPCWNRSRQLSSNHCDYFNRKCHSEAGCRHCSFGVWRSNDSLIWSSAKLWDSFISGSSVFWRDRLYWWRRYCCFSGYFQERWDHLWSQFTVSARTRSWSVSSYCPLIYIGRTSYYLSLGSQWPNVWKLGWSDCRSPPFGEPRSIWGCLSNYKFGS